MSDSKALEPKASSQQMTAYFPNESDWKMMLDVGAKAIKSGMLPLGIKTPEAAAIIALKARELNMPLMVGFAHIHVINGKPTLSAEMMQALARKNLPGLVINILESSSEKAIIEFIRPEAGSRPYKITFTIEDAKRADLLKNPTWTKYPGAMLWSRAVAAGLRKVCPEALIGVSYTPEELGANVDAEGNVIHTTGRHVHEPHVVPVTSASASSQPAQTEDEDRKNLLKSITKLMEELDIDPARAQRICSEECGATSLKTASHESLTKFFTILMKEKNVREHPPATKTEEDKDPDSFFNFGNSSKETK
jgi:hypothetical protein